MNGEQTDFKSAWQARVQDWQARLDEAGMGGVAHALTEGLRPLAPLAAQFLWFTQPGFALFGQSDLVSSLADFLDDPPGKPPRNNG